MARGDRSGFTLVELLVAMAVGAAVILGGRMLVDQLALTARDVGRAAARMDAEANAERALRALVARLEVGTDLAERFSGDHQEAHFGSWCDTPGGWQERCRVTLAIEPLSSRSVGAMREEAHALVATLSTGERVVVRDGVRQGVIGYQSDARAGGRWLRSWGGSITAPQAIVVLLDLGARRDTVILRIGERG